MWLNHRRLGARIGALLLLAVCSAGAGERFDIDAVHSAIGFKVRHFFSPTAGRFTEFSGTLDYDAAHPEQSSIELLIQAASIDTDNDRRDAHLRSDDFLATETYPTITFRSTKIEATDAPNHFRVIGDFTLRGITRPVTVEVEILGFGEISGMGTRGGFLAKTTINRQDFGVRWNKILDRGGTMLGDEVQIECPIEVIKS